VNNSAQVLACPLCNNHFSHVRFGGYRDAAVFGYGLDFRLVARDCNRATDVATCPKCSYAARVHEFGHHVPGHVKDLVHSRDYENIFARHPEQEHPARSWVALISVLDARRLNPRDLGITSLKGSWVARELGCLNTEEELLGLADTYLDDALRRGLTKGDPGMVMYLLGEINRRRRELRRAKEMLTFLGNNPRYRYPALLLTVLIEEEDSTPYWSHYAPDRMEQHSAVFKGLFPALRSIPPNKIQFSANELRDDAERSDEDDRQSF